MAKDYTRVLKAILHPRNKKEHTEHIVQLIELYHRKWGDNVTYEMLEHSLREAESHYN
jgi:hypothetical protein